MTNDVPPLDLIGPQRDLLGLPIGQRDVDWERLVRPRRAVFIGATDREGSQQRAQFVFLRDRVTPHGCELIPVHPVKPSVLGITAVRSVLDVDGDIDLAVVLVRDALPAVEECVRKLYTLSGGTAAHLVDLCAAGGVPVPRLSAATIKVLGEHIPPILRFDNPIDTGGTLTALPAGRITLEAVADDANTNVIMVPITGVFPGMIEPLARDIVELHASGRKPILVIWASPVRDNDGYRMLCSHGVPLFHSLTAGVRGAKALLGHRRFTAGYQSPFGALPTVESAGSAAVRSLLRASAALDEVEAKEMLRQYDIPVVAEQVVTSASAAREAVRAAGGLGVLKVLSPDIGHKSDLGLVRVGVSAVDALIVPRVPSGLLVERSA